MSVSRSWAWPTFPECMTTKRRTRRCSRAQGFARALGWMLATSIQFGMTRIRSARTPFSSSRSFIVSPIATTRSAERSDELTSRRSARSTNGLRRRPSLTAISGKTSCAITSSGTRKRAATSRPMAPTKGGSVMQTTRSGRRRKTAFQRTPMT